MTRFELKRLVENTTNNVVDAARLMEHIDKHVAAKQEETLDKAFYQVAILPYEGWFCRKKVTLKAALQAVNSVYMDYLGIQNKRYAKG